MKIIVAIPCYNCEKQIARVLDGFNPTLMKQIDEIIVINNRSTDNTVLEAKKAINRRKLTKISILTNSKNYHLGGTHKVAFLYAEKKNADYLAIIHGDDHAKTSELKNLIAIAKKNPPVDAILGSRFSKNSKLKGYSIERIYGNKILNLLFTLVSLRKTEDLGSGLNLFKIKPLKDHHYLAFGDNITFNIDILLDYYRKKSKLIFLPISWSETDQISNAKNFQVAWLAVSKLFRWRVRGEKHILKNPQDYTYSIESLLI